MSREAYFPTSPIKVERLSDSDALRDVQQEKSIGEIQTLVEAEVEGILAEMEIADTLLDLEMGSESNVIGQIACGSTLW